MPATLAGILPVPSHYPMDGALGAKKGVTPLWEEGACGCLLCGGRRRYQAAVGVYG